MAIDRIAWVHRAFGRVWIDPSGRPLIPADTEITAHFEAARRTIAGRMLIAGWREGLLEATLEGGRDGLLLVPHANDLGAVPLSDVDAFDAPRLASGDDPRWQPFDAAWPGFAQAVARLASNATPPSPDDRTRVCRELEDSAFNLGLARLAELARHRRASEIGDPAVDRRLFDPEHFVTDGHPWHPMTRTRLGLHAAQHLRHAPEQAAVGDVLLVDVRRELLQITDAFALWSRERFGAPPAGFERLVVHPVQAKKLATRLPGFGVDFRPVQDTKPRGCALLSLRTVRLRDSPDHVKLSLDVHTTSARRIVSSMSVRNGPLVSSLLHEVMDADPEARLDLMDETRTAGLDPARVGADISRELGVIARDVSGCDDGWVLAALGERWPGTSRRVIERACEGYAGPPKAQALAFLDAVLEHLARPSLRLLVAHGIALETHLQNVRVHVERGRVVRFVVRDLGGIRLHRGRLARHGPLPHLDPNSFILTDDLDEVRDKLAHVLFHATLSSIVGWLEPLGIPPRQAWRRIQDRTCEWLDRWCRAWEAMGSSGAALAGEARADQAYIFAPRGRAKALLSMRLGGRFSDYDYTDVATPWSDDRAVDNASDRSRHS